MTVRHHRTVKGTKVKKHWKVTNRPEKLNIFEIEDHLYFWPNL